MINAKVLLTRPFPESIIQHLQSQINNFTVSKIDAPMNRADLLKKVAGCHGLITMLSDKIDNKLMDAAGENLRIVANYAVGYDNIDIAAATARNITVTNTPGVLTDATADLTWALLLAVTRRIPEAETYTRAGKFNSWGPLLFLGRDIVNKTIGIVGAGRIGTAVAQRSSGWNMRVLYVARKANPKLDKLGAKQVPLEQLLQEADFISLNVPYSKQTHHLINKKALAMMKPSAYLINTARGAVIDEAALTQVLKAQKIAGAGLDVYEFEPQITEDLKRLPNVVLAPHIGSATIETRTRMAEIAAQSVFDVLNGRKPEHVVNPEVWN